MAGASNPSSGPKILLAKPGLGTAGPAGGKLGRVVGGGEEETAPHAHLHRSRLPSLNLLSDSWEFQIDRFLPVTHLSSSLTSSSIYKLNEDIMKNL